MAPRSPGAATVRPGASACRRPGGDTVSGWEIEEAFGLRKAQAGFVEARDQGFAKVDNALTIVLAVDDLRRLARVAVTARSFSALCDHTGRRPTPPLQSPERMRPLHAAARNPRSFSNVQSRSDSACLGEGELLIASPPHPKCLGPSDKQSQRGHP